MPIKKQDVAKQFAAYFHHQIELPQLVDWAENAIMDAAFYEKDAATASTVVARLGVADVRAFVDTLAQLQVARMRTQSLTSQLRDPYPGSHASEFVQCRTSAGLVRPKLQRSSGTRRAVWAE